MCEEFVRRDGKGEFNRWCTVQFQESQNRTLKYNDPIYDLLQFLSVNKERVSGSEFKIKG